MTLNKSENHLVYAANFAISNALNCEFRSKQDNLLLYSFDAYWNRFHLTVCSSFFRRTNMLLRNMNRCSTPYMGVRVAYTPIYRGSYVTWVPVASRRTNVHSGTGSIDAIINQKTIIKKTAWNGCSMAIFPPAPPCQHSHEVIYLQYINAALLWRAAARNLA